MIVDICIQQVNKVLVTTFNALGYFKQDYSTVGG